MKASDSLHDIFLKYLQAFMVQTAHTATANACAKLAERLARWILIAHDRVRGNTLPLTHEFLGLMLRVRRAGVTEGVAHPRKAKTGRSRQRPDRGTQPEGYRAQRRGFIWRTRSRISADD